MSFNEILEEVESLDQKSRLTLLEKIYLLMEHEEDKQIIDTQIHISENRIDLIESGEIELYDIDEF